MQLVVDSENEGKIHLDKIYSGPVSGLIKHGIIFKNNGKILDKEIISALLDSLGLENSLKVSL
jgi:hypothetical protein